MITDCFDDKTEPVISLRDFYGEQKHLVETCLILFSQKIYQHLLEAFPCEKIGLIGACNGNIPIYRMNYKGTDVAFYLSGIGSAIAASECYEASWIVGASKFVMFGSCGSLNREATRGKFIVPTESYRGEGCSYYFAAPSDYITVENAQKLSDIFTELGVPHVTGLVWTTDAMIRETAGLVAQRRSEGCLAVEMEPVCRRCAVFTAYRSITSSRRGTCWRRAATMSPIFAARTTTSASSISRWKRRCASE